MDHPVFTIVIPTFNSGKTISRALESLKIQTFLKYEILIIDGLSADQTIDLVQTYAVLDHRIRLITEKDLGIFDAMNKGIHLASGDWIYFMGSDDRLHDAFVLENVFEEIKKGNCKIIYGYIISDRYGRYGGPVRNDGILKNNISHQAIFYQKNVFSEFGLYNLEYKTHADWEFNLRCFSGVNDGIKFIDLAIADYAAGGASSVHEVKLFRQVLLPGRLKQMEVLKKRKLYSAAWFDEWWRFIRNAKLRSVEEISKFAPGRIISPEIRLMVNSQAKISEKQLANGFVSKLFMGRTYVNYLCRKMLNKL